jgi:nucleotide sugar dehydrogenase
MESVGIIGVGKLGLCMTLALEGAGYNMVCYEKNATLSSAISNKSLETIEPGVKECLEKARSIHMVDSLVPIYRLPVAFIIVATPSLESGAYNHSAVDEVVAELLRLNKEEPSYESKLLVISCTTMPLFCDSIQERLLPYNYRVCYNPEFIAQGDILKGLKNPDMVLIGHNDQGACDKLVEIYKRFLENTPVFQTMTCVEAEITKISLNCFLTTKIAFANMIGDIVVKAGGNPDSVLQAIGSDSRVGKKFLKWGHGFGGPCLPRDNRALCVFADTVGIEHIIGETTDESNKRHLAQLFDYIQLKNKDKKPLLFNSVVYKQGTHILEESQKLELAILCAQAGLSVNIYDSEPVLIQLKAKFGAKFNYLYTLEGEYFDVNSYIA